MLQLEKLDAVLNILSENSGSLLLPDLGYRLTMKYQHLHIDPIEITQLLKKITGDGYAVQKLTNIYLGDVAVYSITIEGNIFNATGGYSARNKALEVERASKVDADVRVQRANEQTLLNQKRQTTINVVIAGGTIVAAIFYLIEIFKKIKVGIVDVSMALFLVVASIMMVVMIRLIIIEINEKMRK
jgi:uncharacterized membrane protein YidH (DUF202 family)